MGRSHVILLFALASSCLSSEGQSFNSLKNLGARKTRAKAVSRSAEKAKFDYRLTPGFRGTYFEDANNRDSLTAFTIKAKAETQFLDNLNGSATVQALFEQGTSQGLANRSTRRASGFFLRDAKVSYAPAKWLALQAGAIDQGGQASSMITASQPYPALKQVLRVLETKKTTFKMTTQEAIPTSQNLSTRAIEKEALPGYYSAYLEFSHQLNNYSMLKAKGGYNHFQNLPSAVAGDSCDLGNSVTSCQANANFEWGFQVVDYQLETVLALTSRINHLTYINYIENLAAEAGHSQGYKGITGFAFRIGRMSVLKIKGGYFEKQSDSAAGFYANWIEEANRRGLLAEVSWSKLDSGLKFGAALAETRPLTGERTGAFQQPVTNVLLTMESAYGNF